MSEVNNDVHLYSIAIFKYHEQAKEATLVTSAFDMSSFGYFVRGKAQEFCLFASRTAATRSTKNVRESFQTGDYVCYYQRLPSGIVAVVTATTNYPSRIAFDLVSRVARMYDARVGGIAPEGKVDSMAKDAEFSAMLAKYQNPADGDPIMRMQKEINEVTEIMHDNIEKILRRGEKIDGLVAASNDLSEAAKGWVKTTSKLNRRCNCSIM